MATARATLLPMTPAMQADANGEMWNAMPNMVFLKRNLQNSADADRYVTSVANLQTFMAETDPKKETYTIMDCREEPIYNARHIQGAVNFPIMNPVVGEDKFLPDPSTVISTLEQAKKALAPDVEPENLPPVFKDALKKDIVIFHCFRSTNRGPHMASAFANYLQTHRITGTKVVCLNGGFDAVEKYNTRVDNDQKVPMDGSQVVTWSTSNANEVAGDVGQPSTIGGLLAETRTGLTSSAPLERPPPAANKRKFSVVGSMETEPHRDEEPHRPEKQPHTKLRFARRLVTAPYA